MCKMAECSYEDKNGGLILLMRDLLRLQLKLPPIKEPIVKGAEGLGNVVSNCLLATDFVELGV